MTNTPKEMNISSKYSQNISTGRYNTPAMCFGSNKWVKLWIRVQKVYYREAYALKQVRTLPTARRGKKLLSLIIKEFRSNTQKQTDRQCQL